MALERRQFIETSLIGGNGKNRELTVNSYEGRLYVHTASKPQGIGVANKAELDSAVSNLESQIANMQASHWSHMEFEREVENWINVATAPDDFDGTSYWPWTPASTARQALLDAGYTKMTIISVNMFSDIPLTEDDMFRLRISLNNSTGNYLHNDLLIGNEYPRMRIYNGMAIVSIPVFAKTEMYGRLHFVASYTNSATSIADSYDSPVSQEFNIKDGDINYRGWSKVTEDDELWWKAELKPIDVAVAYNGLTLEPVSLNVVSYAVNKDNSENRFGGWFEGSGTNQLVAKPVVYIKATDSDNEPPLGFTCRVRSVFNVT